MPYCPIKFDGEKCICPNCGYVVKSTLECDKVVRQCPAAKRIRGLGDLIHFCLNAIGITRKRYITAKCHVARWLHYLWILPTPTAEKWCKTCGCKKRQEALNRWFPFQ